MLLEPMPRDGGRGGWCSRSATGRVWQQQLAQTPPWRRRPPGKVWVTGSSAVDSAGHPWLYAASRCPKRRAWSEISSCSRPIRPSAHRLVVPSTRRPLKRSSLPLSRPDPPPTCPDGMVLIRSGSCWQDADGLPREPRGVPCGLSRPAMDPQDARTYLAPLGPTTPIYAPAGSSVSRSRG